MLPFFPPGSDFIPLINGDASDPNPSQRSTASTLPPFPLNQAPQFNFPNPANMAMFNPNPQIAMQSGTNMKSNAIQSTRTAANATHENASGNFETNQHSVPYKRFQNNDFRPNSRQFSGSRGRSPGAMSGRVGGRGLRYWRESAPEEKSPGPLEIKKKRRPTITYDEKEIKQWREARKRNFPTTANIKKKLAVKDKKAENENDDRELQRKPVTMLPFFPPGSDPKPPIIGVASDPNPSQGSMLPPFPLNQAPQFNFPNPANMAMFNPNPQIAMQSGTNMKNNVIQSTRTAANAIHENASGKNLETNQHSVAYTRFQNNDSRHNSRQFSGSRGRSPGAISGRVGGRGLRYWRELAPEEKSPGPLEIKKKRLPTITYDEEEIKQWREARKRNFPTKDNIKKKLAVKDKKAENENDDRELQRKGSTLPPFPLNQAPQFNFPNPTNMAMFNPNTQIAMQSGTNMKSNVIQSTRTAANATHENASGKNFETNQHSVPYKRFQNNDSRQNSRQFSGSRGGRGLRDRRELAPEEKSPGPLKIKKKRLPTITYDEEEIKQWREARKRNFPTKDNIKKLVILMKKKRLPAITYDEEEIKQWREARKRNFPITANIKRKLAVKDKKAENENDDWELQRKFMDMTFLQAELPAQQPAADYYSTGAYASQFYTQNPASRNASPMPQGGIPQTIDQTLNPQILNSMPQGYPSLGSNLFA